MGKFFNGNKFIRKVWNVKDIFKVEGWQNGNISTSNYWDMSPLAAVMWLPKRETYDIKRDEW